MNRTELNLDVAKSFNLKIMRLVDTSNYFDGEEIDNYLIEVLPVNRSKWVTFNVAKDFSLVLNSSNLGYQKVDKSIGLADLPDGIYEIKQSYKPNSQTVGHYYHLRTSSLILKYIEVLGEHFSEQCAKDKRTYREEEDLLVSIRQYIEAAEYMVSEKLDKDSGIKFYNQAVDLIKKLEDDCGCRPVKR